MNVEYLLNELEGLVHHLPHRVQGPLDDVIETVRHIYENTLLVITPHEPVHDGSRALVSHHQRLQDLHTQLSNNAATLQLVYQGEAANSYHAAASASLGHLQTTLDHVAFASQQHDTMSLQFGDATTNQLLLITMLGLVVITLGSIPATAGVDSEIAVPAAVGEVAGAGGIIATLTAALQAAGAAIAALEIDSMTLGMLAFTIGAVLDRPQTIDPPAISITQANSTTTTIPQDWANSPDIAKWRESIKNALKAKGLTDVQILAALAAAAAVVKAMECNGYSAREIDALMNSWADIYDPNTKQLRKGAVKGSFWFILALLVKKTTGYDLINKLPLPDPGKIPTSDFDGYRRVLRSVLATDGEDGNGRPVVPAIISGGPTNIAAYGSKVYSDASGNSYLSQVEYDQLPPDQIAMWHLIDGDVDIVTNDGKHIEVGGTNKGASPQALAHFEEVQLDRLLKLPGGRSTAYVFLERPGAGSSPLAVANFEKAVNVARTKLDPSHVIIIGAPSDTCTIP